MRAKVRDFSLDKTLNAGQTFGWSRVGKSWASFFDFPLLLTQKDDETLEFYGGSKEKVQEMLGLNDDIEGIRAEIDRDDFIDKAINFLKRDKGRKRRFMAFHTRLHLIYTVKRSFDNKKDKINVLTLW